MFVLHFSIKTKILSMLGIGYFWKSQKLIPSKKHQSFLIAKICSCKTQNIADLQKINSRKNFVPHGSIKNKIVDLYDCYLSFKFLVWYVSSFNRILHFLNFIVIHATNKKLSCRAIFFCLRPIVLFEIFIGWLLCNCYLLQSQWAIT